MNEQRWDPVVSTVLHVCDLLTTFNGLQIFDRQLDSIAKQQYARLSVGSGDDNFTYYTVAVLSRWSVRRNSSAHKDSFAVGWNAPASADAFSLLLSPYCMGLGESV